MASTAGRVAAALGLVLVLAGCTVRPSPGVPADAGSVATPTAGAPAAVGTATARPETSPTASRRQAITAAQRAELERLLGEKNEKVPELPAP